ncbi:MAG: pyridoxal phosphate-dependent aminotransferase [Hyphomicrobiaceae bacterium]|nr:pyridoxal phosphate-dependent aminotransferase [Hyphomicrobiaceae bacterium]MCC0006955.1 pyridoxal phosphate-dependent aminotransferase [Hyphomicrobiaceae bacterium]
MSNPLVNARIRAIPPTVPFVGPEALTRKTGHQFKARIGANESVFGPSPAAIAVMQNAAAQNWMYADPESFELRTAIARHLGFGADNVVIGEGIDGLLGLTLHIVLSPGETVVTSDGAYPTFNFHVAMHSGRLVKVPYRNDKEDLAALLDTAKREKARVLYVSNPDNPMGSWWPASEIERLMEGVPEDMLLILDEAYGDTAPEGTLPAVDVTRANVLRYRTFSKAYGLAGARVGYCFGPAQLIAEFEKVRNHYGINRVGQLGALAALQDQAYLKKAVADIARARGRIADIARANGLEPLASATNFVAIDCGRDSVYAKRILDGVLARDVFIRMPGVAPLSRCIRVSCGTDADLDRFAQALAASLANPSGA